jgi:hypothetical protein
LIYHCDSLVFEFLKPVLYHPHTVKGIGGCARAIAPRVGVVVWLVLHLIVQGLGEFLAPRAGLEPATKRLTAAHSTIELPGNEYLSATAQIR